MRAFFALSRYRDLTSVADGFAPAEGSRVMGPSCSKELCFTLRLGRSHLPEVTPYVNSFPSTTSTSIGILGKQFPPQRLAYQPRDEPAWAGITCPLIPIALDLLFLIHL
jgi:hypothetical protein